MFNVNVSEALSLFLNEDSFAKKYLITLDRLYFGTQDFFKCGRGCNVKVVPHIDIIASSPPYAKSLLFAPTHSWRKQVFVGKQMFVFNLKSPQLVNHKVT